MFNNREFIFDIYVIANNIDFIYDLVYDLCCCKITELLCNRASLYLAVSCFILKANVVSSKKRVTTYKGKNEIRMKGWLYFREKKLDDQRVKDKEADIRRREQDIRRMEKEYEQRLHNEMTK